MSNLFVSTDLGGLPWWVILIIVVILLLIVMAIPSKFWKKIGTKKDRSPEQIELKTGDGRTIISESYIERASDFEKACPSPKKEKLLLGMYNGAGHKTAIRTKSLVYVYPEHDSCDLCRPFEGQILSLEKLDNEVVTMAEAISKGYHHVGCKHVDVDYYPKETEIPTSPWDGKEQTSFHKQVLKLLRMENDLRVLTFNIDNGNSKNPANDQLKINHLKEEIIYHTEKHNLTFTDRRQNPYISDTEKFNYLPIEDEEKK